MPPHRGLKAISHVLYSNHSELDPLQKSQTQFLQQTSRKSLTQHNKPWQRHPGPARPPNSEIIQIPESLSFENSQSQTVHFLPRLWQVLVEMRIEVICVLEIRIASVLIEGGGEQG